MNIHQLVDSTYTIHREHITVVRSIKGRPGEVTMAESCVPLQTNVTDAVEVPIPVTNISKIPEGCMRLGLTFARSEVCQEFFNEANFIGLAKFGGAESGCQDRQVAIGH